MDPGRSTLVAHPHPRLTYVLPAAARTPRVPGRYARRDDVELARVVYSSLSPWIDRTGQQAP